MKKKYKLRSAVKSLTKFILFLLLFCVTTFICGGFSNNFCDNQDDLFVYQWGLHGKPNFVVNQESIKNTYVCQEFTEEYCNEHFMNNSDSNSNNEFVKAVNNLSISFNEAYRLLKTVPNRRDIVVAIIDSGVDINHSELKRSIWTNKNEIPDNGIDDDGNGYIDDIHGYNFYNDTNEVFTSESEDIHGTHSAGTIVAEHCNGGIKGIAYDKHIKIMSLKILGNNGAGKISNFIKAVEYAEKNGASICNVSLGTYIYKSELEEVIKNSNMLFVVACGNGEKYVGYDIDDSKVYPASFDFDNIITVGNLSLDGTLYESSNYGDCVTVTAPGTMILSSIPNEKYGFITGTSMAAPMVTAVCAMLMSCNKNVNAKNIKKIIEISVDKIDGLKHKIKSEGIINAFKAIQIAVLY